MTAGLAERLRPRPRLARRRNLAHVELAAGGRLTLDELVSSAWAGLSAGAPVGCPLCGEHMAPSPDGVGRCRACDSSLS
jgi:hypothetical protein